MTPKAQVLWQIAHFLGKEFSYWSGLNRVGPQEEQFLVTLEVEWRAACMRAELQEEWDLADEMAANEPGSCFPHSDEWENTRI